MGSRYRAVIKVPMIAMELIKAGKAPSLVPGYAAMTRQELHVVMKDLVQKDLDNLGEERFRMKYVNYIRKYWGQQTAQIHR